MIGFCSLCGQFSFRLERDHLCHDCHGAHAGSEFVSRNHLMSAERTGYDHLQNNGSTSDTPDLHEKESFEGGASGGGGASRDFSADEGSEGDTTSSDDSAGDSDDGGSDD